MQCSNLLDHNIIYLQHQNTMEDALRVCALGMFVTIQLDLIREHYNTISNPQKHQEHLQLVLSE